MQVVAALLLLLVVVALVTRRVSATSRSATTTYWSNFFQPPNTGSYRCHPTQRPFLPKRAPKTASERGYPAPPIPTPTQQISPSSCAHKANEGAISRFQNRSKR